MIIARCLPSPYLVRSFAERPITHAFHDIDGTHSLIRDWPPVMSIVLADVIANGLPEGFDSDQNHARLVAAAGAQPLPETDRFCIESAGLSALTQMEWAIRRSVEEGRIPVDCDRTLNVQKIRLIEQGVEIFDDLAETAEMECLLKDGTPRLFRFYERVLNGYCRDRNLASARKDPALFRVPGSMEFLRHLHENGVRNYFVTGAVVERGMGMFEEVEALGYELGPGKRVENIIGSTWNDKLPKNIIMARMLRRLHIRGENVLVVGDGRAEISAGVGMGALTLSRLPKTAIVQRELHQRLGTHLIVPDYTPPALYDCFTVQEFGKEVRR